MGLVPHDQTIQRAEAIAVLVAMARSWDPIYIGSDSRFAVNYCRLLIKDPDIDVSNWAHPDIWMCIQTVLHEVGTDWIRIKWIKGHALNDECLASGVATLEDAFGNDQADRLAAKGSRLLKIDKHHFRDYTAHIRSIAFAQAFVLRIWESRDRVGRGDVLPQDAGGPSADPSTPHTMPDSSQAQSVSDFNPGIHDPVVLDSGPALFPGYPWGWPTDGIPYEVALPPNFELAHIQKRKTNWICSLALFSAAINYFNGLRWKVLEGTGVSIAELALDFEMSQSVLLSSKNCPLPSASQDKTWL